MRGAKGYTCEDTEGARRRKTSMRNRIFARISLRYKCEETQGFQIAKEYTREDAEGAMMRRRDETEDCDAANNIYSHIVTFRARGGGRCEDTEGARGRTTSMRKSKFPHISLRRRREETEGFRNAKEYKCRDTEGARTRKARGYGRLRCEKELARGKKGNIPMVRKVQGQEGSES